MRKEYVKTHEEFTVTSGNGGVFEVTIIFFFF